MRLRKFIASILVCSMMISVLPGNISYASEITESTVISEKQEMEDENVSNDARV